MAIRIEALRRLNRKQMQLNLIGRGEKLQQGAEVTAPLVEVKPKAVTAVVNLGRNKRLFIIDIFRLRSISSVFHFPGSIIVAIDFKSA